MSLYDPPRLCAEEYIPCTCRARLGAMTHDKSCAKMTGEGHAAQQAAEIVRGQAARWYGKNDPYGMGGR